jgi:PBP1b-binding outer membrane lipoprotein LpoB
MTRNVLMNIDLKRSRIMFRVSFVILALASALALNGCSQCSQQGTETAPGTEATATPADAAAAPADAMAPAATPAEGAAPADAAATPAVDGAAATPAEAH